eukprot:83527_1
MFNKLFLLAKKWYKQYWGFRIVLYSGIYYFLRRIQIQTHRIYYQLPRTGPTGITFFGCLFSFRWSAVQFYKSMAKYGKICSYQILNRTIILINDPELAKQIYNDPTTANRYEPYLSNVSNTITFLNGPKWKQRRKNIHTNLLTAINSQFVVEGSTKFLKTIMFPDLNKKYIETNQKITILLSDIFRPLTFNLVLFATLGVHIKSLNDPFWIKYNQYAYTFWNAWGRRVLCAMIFGDNNEKFAKRLTPESEEIRISMVNLVKHCIANSDSNALHDSFYMKMKELNSLTEDEIVSDISSLLLPSIDTTSNTLAFCVICLCKYKDIQNRVYEEVKNVFGDVDRINLSSKYLSKLVQFRSYIYEVLRLYPTTITSAIHFYKDWNNKQKKYIVINVDGNEYKIWDNCLFWINNYAISRNQKYWIHEYNNKYEDKVFDMERINFEFWIDNNGKFRQNKSLSSFSFGPRECVGKTVAIKNLYVVLAALMLTYEFSVENDFDIKTQRNPMLTPKPLPIIIRKR